jgi:NhaP-type Na+/H+ or K+/H+ antiporter
LNVTGGGLVASSELLSNIVLGFIAFHIGKNFSVAHFKKIGKAVLSVSISVTIATLICVTAGIYYVAHQPFHIALLFGAIATATAPATTMMIRQYKARGLFTDVLLGTVAIDDAWGIMIFSVSLAIAQVLQIGQFSEWIIVTVTIKAAVKIFLSALLGSITAIIASRISGYLKRREDVLTIILGAEQSIRRHMGLALMAQAGVAIGLAMMAKASRPHTGGAILNTIIATTVAYEILGPIATRYTLLKAKNINT